MMGLSVLDCDRVSSDLAPRPRWCCARKTLLREAVAQETSKGFSCNSARKVSLGLGIQSLWIRRVFLLPLFVPWICYPSRLAEEDNWGSWSAEPSAVPETLDSHPTAAEAMPEVLDSPPTASQVMPEVLDPTSTVEALQVRNPSLQPRLQLAAATLTSMTPVPALGSMPSPSAPAPKRRRTFADLLRATPKVRSTGRVAARAWDQASEASSSREFYLDLNRLPDPIAELSPLAYKMYAKAGPETTRLVGRALERYNKMLMLDYSEEVMEPKETPVIPCWTALERCLEEDLAEAKKLEESAGDFVESIFGPIYSCTPKKEFDSASVGCLTEDLEEQTRLRLSRIRLGSFLGKINIGNTEALESLRSIRSYLVLEDLHGYRLLVGSTYDFQHARVGDLEEARKDPQFLRRMEALRIRFGRALCHAVWESSCRA